MLKHCPAAVGVIYEQRKYSHFIDACHHVLGVTLTLAQGLKEMSLSNVSVWCKNLQSRAKNDLVS